MNVSDWIALGALAVAAIGPSAGMLTARGKRDGKIDAILERLTDTADDHEDRIRTLEQS